MESSESKDGGALAPRSERADPATLFGYSRSGGDENRVESDEVITSELDLGGTTEDQ
jgi:hypothetical protein